MKYWCEKNLSKNPPTPEYYNCLRFKSWYRHHGCAVHKILHGRNPRKAVASPSTKSPCGWRLALPEVDPLLNSSLIGGGL